MKVEEDQTQTQMVITQTISGKDRNIHYTLSNFYFKKDNINHLSIKLETPKLCLESLSPSHLSYYSKLFYNPNNMAKFADGQNWRPEKTKQRMEVWINRLFSNDPFAAYAVLKKKLVNLSGMLL